MKKEWKYFLILGGAAIIYIVVKLFSPRDHDWIVTFHKEDKNPFGAYALDQLISDLFPGHLVKHSYETIYELYDSIDSPVNFFTVCSSFSAGKEDIIDLLKNVDSGGNAFIATQNFDNSFSDTLKIQTGFNYNYYYGNNGEAKDDSTTIVFTNPHLKTDKQYKVPRNNMRMYFNKFDTTTTKVVAVNDNDQPVLIHIKWGKGDLYLCSTPLVFTNAYFLTGDNPDFIASALSLLPNNNLIWTEFYHLGRLEIDTPLRFVLSQESLRWAYYITILSILIFMIFEAKRKQRIIPVIKPLTNTSLEFVTTIGNLYFQNGDHKDIADKKIGFMLEHIRSKYWLNTNKITPDFLLTLSKRSGHSEEEIKELFHYIAQIQTQYVLSSHELIELNKKIEKFYSQPK